jgi:hypothetical protein
MSSDCHFLFGGDFRCRFRVTVVNIVTTRVSFNRETLPFQTDFRLAGTRCLLSTNSHEILQAASNWRQPVEDADMLSFEMEIVVDSRLDNAPEHSAHFRGLGCLVFAMVPPRSFIAYDLLRRRVQVALSNTAACDYSFWSTMLLPITVGVLGATVGVVPLHCACLDRGGSGLLVAGASGTGKSTLATALAAQGFSFLSDDWTYVSKQQSRLVAHGLSTPIKLLPDAVRFFADLDKLTPHTTLNGELAYELDPVSNMGFHVRTFSLPQRLFFLERSATPGCDMVPCRPEYIEDYFARSVERLPAELTEAKEFRTGVIKMLSASQAWILRTGESPQRTAAAMDDFLSREAHAIS